MKRRTAILLELVSVIVWLKLADHLGQPGPFGWAGPVCGLLASCIVAPIALAVSARAIWRQPAGGREFWVIFSLMMGGILGMILCVLYGDLVLLKS